MQVKRSKTIGFILSGIMILGLGCSSSNSCENEKHPNILLVIVDQLSAEVMGNSGCTWVSTPNIDRLAKKVVTSSNAPATARLHRVVNK